MALTTARQPREEKRLMMPATAVPVLGKVEFWRDGVVFHSIFMASTAFGFSFSAFSFFVSAFTRPCPAHTWVEYKHHIFRISFRNERIRAMAKRKKRRIRVAYDTMTTLQNTWLIGPKQKTRTRFHSTFHKIQDAPTLHTDPHIHAFINTHTHTYAHNHT